MKKLLSILFLCVLIVACKKKAATPATTTAPPPSTNTTSSLTPLETSLVANWIMDSTQVWSFGVIDYTLIHTDPINCHLKLDSTLYGVTAPTWRKCDVGIHCAETTEFWRITNNKLDINNVLYQIILCNPTRLTILDGTTSTGGSGVKFFMHK